MPFCRPAPAPPSAAARARPAARRSATPSPSLHDGALADAGDGARDLDGARRGAATSISIVPPPPSWVASSCSVPWATISPRWMTSRRSQVWLISDRMWLDSRIVCSPRSAADDRAHLDDLHRVEAAGRLVEDEQLRLVHQRLGHADALPVAVRQAGDRAGRAPRASRSSPRPRPRRAPPRAAGTPRSSRDEGQVAARRSSRCRAAACRAGSRCGAAPRAGRARCRCRRRSRRRPSAAARSRGPSAWWSCRRR